MDAGFARVERLVDDGTAFRKTHELIETFVGRGGLAIHGDDAWLFGGELTAVNGGLTLRRLHPEADGGISGESRRIPGLYPVAISVGPAAAMLIVSDGMRQWLTLASEDGGLREFKDAGFNSGFAQASSGFWMLAGDQNPAEILQSNDLVHVSSSDGAPVWTRSQLPLHTEPFLGPLMFGIPILDRGTSAMPSKPDVVVPRWDGTKVALEAYDAGPEFQRIVGASRTHAFALSLDGGSLKIFDR